MPLNALTEFRRRVSALRKILKTDSWAGRIMNASRTERLEKKDIDKVGRLHE